jgi:hypothetical protein
MPGSSIGSFEDVSRVSLIEQCKSVLKAGGTVYLGETHKTEDGRKICCDVLAGRCVQYLCIEYDSALQQQCSLEELTELIHHQEYSECGHHPPVAMKTVIEACTSSGGDVVLVDAQAKHKKNSTKRQNHVRDQIKEYRRKVNRIGRGVLVLIGADHLKNVDDRDTWKALHEIVYDGLSFVYGKYKNCLMVWQLS